MPEILPNWHPIVVHFAIGLLLTGAALFALATAVPGRPASVGITVAARWNLILGATAALLALATGWWAYQTVVHDARSHANMVVHMRWALGTAAVFALAALLTWVDRRRSAGAAPLLLATLAAGVGGLTVTGWLGGENVYRYGLGVISLPAADGHQHGAHHHHDEAHSDGPGGGGNAAGPEMDHDAADHDHR